MQYLRSAKSVSRKLVLLGWAFAVIWIYMGNLVNFHQNRIWGKQLIPVACYSTRAKEKEGLFVIKSDSDSRISLPITHFDFVSPDQQAINIVYSFFIPSNFNPSDFFLIQTDFTAFSFRGPPSA